MTGLHSQEERPNRTIDDEEGLDTRVSFFRRLSSQMLFIQIAVLVLVLGFVAFFFPSRQRQSASQGLQETGRSLLPFMAEAIRPALDVAYTDDTKTIEEMLLQRHIIEDTFETARLNDDLVYSDLLSPDGKSLVRFLKEGQEIELFRQAYQEMKKADTDQIVTDELVAHRMPILKPDGKTLLGTVVIGFSLQRIQRDANNALMVTLIVSALTLLLSLLATMFLSRRVIIQPLMSLVGGAHQIARGKLTTQLSTSGESELGILARAFGRMQIALKELIKRVKQTSTSVAETVAPVERRSREMLDGARQQSQASEATMKAVQMVDSSALSIDKSLAELNSSTDQVAAGTYELSQSLNTLRDEIVSYSSFVQETDTSMQEMSTTAAEIAEHVNKMAQATESAAASVNQMERSIQVIEGNAADNSGLSESMTERARECQNAVNKTIEGMRQIIDSFEDIDKAVQGLDESVANISKIVQVITDISDQTKLLSLNASILAAQAGEYGKGFSVVADQIKELSDRTADSTKEITTILSTIGHGREATSKAMGRGLQSVEQGRELSEQAGHDIAIIMDMAQKSHQQMVQIADATKEQVRGSKLISQSTNESATMGRNILEGANQQRTAAEQISALTSNMVTRLGAVKRTIDEEAQSSSMVAEQVDRIRSQAGSINEESNTQRRLTSDMVAQIEQISTFAESIVSEAQGVTEDIRGLAEKIEVLTEEVAHFETD